MIELASRTSGCIEVTLLWNRRENTVEVELMNWDTDERFVVQTPPERALDVFLHAFAYAPAYIADAASGGERVT